MTATGFPATLPAPRRPDPLDVPGLRWGVLGTGWIAERFVRALPRRQEEEPRARRGRRLNEPGPRLTNDVYHLT
jgi:hypothetical protein